MSGEAINALSGLPKLLTGLALSAVEMDNQLSLGQIERLVKIAEYLPQLSKELNLTPEQSMALISGLVRQTMHASVIEIVARGDVSIRNSFDVAGKVDVGFAPYVSASLSAGYGSQKSENWGCEIRATLVASPMDTEILAVVLQRAQERPPAEVETPDFLTGILPDLIKLLGGSE